MISRFVLIFLCLFCFFSCGKGANDGSAVVQTDSTQTTTFREIPEWVGVYLDTLPCSDCAGTLTWLELKADFTYKKSITLLGKEPVIDNTFGTEGKLTFDKKLKVVWLDSVLEHQKTGFFVNGDSVLVLTDALGKPETFRFNQLGRRSKKLL